jgi:predicted DNA-binding protein with PD1-like motif
MITLGYDAALAHRGFGMHHPGPAVAERCTSRVATSADQLRIWIAPASTLFDGLIEAVIEHGYGHANIQLFDGELAEANFHVARPDPAGERAIAYAPVMKIAGGARIVTANVTLGHKADGQPIVHCHGVLMDRHGGLYGGHLAPETCVVGEGGVFGWAIVSKDGGFVQRHDPETLFPLLVPTAAEERVR